MAKITDRQMTAKPGTSDKWLSEVAIWGHGSLVARITQAVNASSISATPTTAVSASPSPLAHTVAMAAKAL